MRRDRQLLFSKYAFLCYLQDVSDIKHVLSGGCNLKVWGCLAPMRVCLAVQLHGVDPGIFQRGSGGLVDVSPPVEAGGKAPVGGGDVFYQKRKPNVKLPCIF